MLFNWPDYPLYYFNNLKFTLFEENSEDHMNKLTCFKAYDIRGKLGTELNEEIAYKIGRAYGQISQPKTVVIGCDIRLTQ